MSKKKVPLDFFYHQFPGLEHHKPTDNHVKHKYHLHDPKAAKAHKGLDLRALANSKRGAKKTTKRYDEGGSVSDEEMMKNSTPRLPEVVVTAPRESDENAPPARKPADVTPSQGMPNYFAQANQKTANQMQRFDESDSSQVDQLKQEIENLRQQLNAQKAKNPNASGLSSLTSNNIIDRI